MKTTPTHDLHMSNSSCNATSKHVVELARPLLRHLFTLPLFTLSNHPLSSSTLFHPSNTTKMSAFNFYMAASDAQAAAAAPNENNRGAPIPTNKNNSTSSNDSTPISNSAATNISAPTKRTGQNKKYYCKLHLQTQSLCSITDNTQRLLSQSWLQQHP
jgi:hypothetical protein